MSRRNFMRAGATTGGLAALSAVLAGCGRSSSSDGLPMGIPGTDFTGQLGLLLGSHMTEVQALSGDYANQFGTSVNVQEITTPDLRSVVTTAFLAQQSPWDTAFSTAVIAQELGSRSWLKAVNEFLDTRVRPRGQLMENGMAPVMLGDSELGVPWSMGAPLMHWNRQLMEDVGLDPDAPSRWHEQQNSWDEFVEYAKALTFTRDGVNYYGFTDAWGGSAHSLYTWGSLLQMHGGSFLDEDKQPIFNNEAGVEATMKMYDLLNTYKVVDPAVNTYTWVFDAAPGFFSGQRGMFFTWPFIAGLASNPDASAIAGFSDVAPQPSVDTSASVDGSEYLVVPVFAENEDEAWRFLEYITSPEAQKRIALTGWASIYSDVNLEPEVLAANPVYEHLVKSYEYPVDGGYSEDREIWAGILADQIQEVLGDRKSAKEALDDAVRLIADERAA
jgi:multiple sugar transport system substrate-binding protein